MVTTGGLDGQGMEKMQRKNDTENICAHPAIAGYNFPSRSSRLGQVHGEDWGEGPLISSKDQVDRDLVKVWVEKYPPSGRGMRATSIVEYAVGAWFEFRQA